MMSMNNLQPIGSPQMSSTPVMISSSRRFHRPPRNNMYKPGNSFSFPDKSKPISIPQSGNKPGDSKSSDSTPTNKEYKSFREMKDELSDREIHLQFAKLSLNLWKEETDVLCSSPSTIYLHN